MSRRRKVNSTDPRRLNGALVDEVAAFAPDDDAMSFDASTAVILEQFACAKIDGATLGDRPAVVLNMAGTVNDGTGDKATLLFIVSQAGLAAVAEEIAALRSALL